MGYYDWSKALQSGDFVHVWIDPSGEIRCNLVTLEPHEAAEMANALTEAMHAAIHMRQVERSEAERVADEATVALRGIVPLGRMDDLRTAIVAVMEGRT